MRARGAHRESPGIDPRQVGLARLGEAALAIGAGHGHIVVGEHGLAAGQEARVVLEWRRLAVAPERRAWHDQHGVLRIDAVLLVSCPSGSLHNSRPRRPTGQAGCPGRELLRELLGQDTRRKVM